VRGRPRTGRPTQLAPRKGARERDGQENERHEVGVSHHIPNTRQRGGDLSGGPVVWPHTGTGTWYSRKFLVEHRDSGI
jgi:hypothetical protein